MQVGSESDPRQEPGNLPAPYVSPWLEFSRNLQALFADLQLRAQELWRRNGEGDLSIPGFWPRNLASTFWPVVLVLVVALPLAGLRWWQSAHPTLPEPASSVVAGDGFVPDGVLPETVFPAPLLPEPLITPQPQPALEPEPTLFDFEDPPLPELDLNPLLDLFLDGSAPEGLLASATPQPAQNRLVLQVSDAWNSLGPSVRTSIAEDWQQRSRDLGYSSLQLVDGQQTLLGRSARVGSGMILFESKSVG
ncbi:hypothetical protein [Synechococcus sp. CC9902]|uniref:hypothetical protein n=1 Tax=Synechococcus sp. (strain CC9902) TaxID=316279 RepID=UPI0002D257E1|nr:hypothetical protein [Synechococcus sp. CC9902]